MTSSRHHWITLLVAWPGFETRCWKHLTPVTDCLSTSRLTHLHKVSQFWISPQILNMMQFEIWWWLKCPPLEFVWEFLHKSYATFFVDCVLLYILRNNFPQPYKRTPNGIYWSVIFVVAGPLFQILRCSMFMTCAYTPWNINPVPINNTKTCILDTVSIELTRNCRKIYMVVLILFSINQVLLCVERFHQNALCYFMSWCLPMDISV